MPLWKGLSAMNEVRNPSTKSALSSISWKSSPKVDSNPEKRNIDDEEMEKLINDLDGDDAL